MRWAIPVKMEDEAVDALRLLLREVADPDGVEKLAKSLGIEIGINAPQIPQGNPFAEHSFGTVIGVTRCLMLRPTRSTKTLA